MTPGLTAGAELTHTNMLITYEILRYSNSTESVHKRLLRIYEGRPYRALKLSSVCSDSLPSRIQFTLELQLICNKVRRSSRHPTKSDVERKHVRFVCVHSSTENNHARYDICISSALVHFILEVGAFIPDYYLLRT